jgi:hypothetical protein
MIAVLRKVTGLNCLLREEWLLKSTQLKTRRRQ